MSLASLPVISAEEMAAILRCAVSTVEEHARSGYLAGLKFGDGGWVFPVGANAARLDELAIEQAQARRSPPRPSGVLHALPKRGKAKRVAPVLHNLLSASAPPDPRP